MKQQLSGDAEAALKVLCRLSKGEKFTEAELTESLKAQAMLDLLDADYIYLPAELVDLEFTSLGEGKIKLRRTEEIQLTKKGASYCG